MPDDERLTLRVLAAYAAVYLIWGSTYLAIRVAIETLPPLTMAGVRFVIAGTVLYAWQRARGAAAPAAHHWRSAVVIGGLMLTVGHGGLVWGERTVPSGLASLLVAMTPAWMVLLEWSRSRAAPGLSTFAGLGLGIVGIVILAGPGRLAGGSTLDLAGAAMVLAGTWGWALGSLQARSAPLPASPLLGTAQQMLAGGALLLVLAFSIGEWQRLDPATVSIRSLGALAYLIVFGSLIAYSAYIFLLRATTPARAATYAYVNPIVAVLLGWLAADEPLGPRVGLATASIVAAVVLITRRRRSIAVASQRYR